MEYYICSTSVIDNLYFPNVETKKAIAGGAGIYALAGAKLWTDNVHLLCGVGEDYLELFGDWYKTNNIDTSTLKIVNEKTPVTNIYYDSEYEREEIPKYGVEHYKKFETKADDLTHLSKKEKSGTYVFRNTDKEFWKPILQNKPNKESVIMWEIADDACKPEELDNVKEILKRIDIFSINLTESKKLFNIDDFELIKTKLYELDVPLVFLRLGSKGQMFLTKNQDVFVPSMKSKGVLDVTGGGNSSSGAVLVGYCQNKDLNDLGKMANLSAVMCLSQYGVPENIRNHREKLENNKI